MEAWKEEPGPVLSLRWGRRGVEDVRAGSDGVCRGGVGCEAEGARVSAKGVLGNWKPSAAIHEDLE